jgi:HlyD family secretion protein
LKRAALGAAALAVLGLLAAALGRNGEPAAYLTEPARRGDLVVAVTATGTLQPTNQVDVGSELSGTIRTVEVDFNDRVAKNEVLAKLDTARLEAQVLQSTAALEASRARVAEAAATEAEAKSQLARLARVRELSGGKVPSQSEYAAAEAMAARSVATTLSARAAVAQAEATLETQKTDLGKAVIRSPIDGIVLVRTVEPGQTVAASLQAPVLFTLAEDLTRMELLASVDEADVGQVREGQAARFSVDAWPERRFDARVEQLRFGAQTLEGVVTYQAVLRVDNPELLLRPGMTATAEIVVARLEDALLAPNAALRYTPPDGNGQARGGLLRALLPGRRPWREPQTSAGQARGREQRVWQLRDGRAEELTIETGASDGSWTEIRSGDLEPGAELIVGRSGPAA